MGSARSAESGARPHRTGVGHLPAVGYARGEALGLSALGWCRIQLGDLARGIAACEKALDLLRAAGDHYGMGATWDSLGYAHHRTGDHGRAVECYQSSLELVTAGGDRRGAATVLLHIGDAHEAAGHRAAARDAFGEALAILTDLDHPDAERARVAVCRVDP